MVHKLAALNLGRALLDFLDKPLVVIHKTLHRLVHLFFGATDSPCPRHSVPSGRPPGGLFQ